MPTFACFKLGKMYGFHLGIKYIPVLWMLVGLDPQNPEGAFSDSVASF